MRTAILVILISFCTICNAETWVSPIDKKYQLKSPDLYNKYVKARKALDRYRGRRETLLQAKVLLDDILAKDNKFAPAYREYARLFLNAGHISYGNYQQGALGSTESVLLEAIKIEPEYADAYVLLGHLYTQDKSFYEKAEEALKRAKEIGTEIPWLHLNYAELLNKTKRASDSLEHYMKVINSETDNRNAYSSALEGAARYYRNKKDYDEAKKWYIKSANYDGSAWGWGEYSTFLLFKVGDIDNAIETGEKAISILPYGIGKFHLACAYYTKWAELINTDADAAKIYFDKGVKLSPVSKEVIRKLSRYQPTKNAAIRLAIYYQESEVTESISR